MTETPVSEDEVDVDEVCDEDGIKVDDDCPVPNGPYVE